MGKPRSHPASYGAVRSDGQRYAVHARAVEALQAAYAEVPPGVPVRLAKRTSNLFRFRPSERERGLDVSRFDQVLAVDPQARTADEIGRRRVGKECRSRWSPYH